MQKRKKKEKEEYTTTLALTNENKSLCSKKLEREQQCSIHTGNGALQYEPAKWCRASCTVTLRTVSMATRLSFIKQVVAFSECALRENLGRRYSEKPHAERTYSRPGFMRG